MSRKIVSIGKEIDLCTGAPDLYRETPGDSPRRRAGPTIKPPQITTQFFQTPMLAKTLTTRVTKSHITV